MAAGKTGFQYVDEPEIKLPGVKRVVVLGDPGCTGFSGESAEIFGEILKQEADAFFIIGDLGCIDAEEELRVVLDFCNARVKVPVFALRGNHELSQYSKFLGRTSYALVLDHHVCFFLCNATGHFDSEGLDLLKRTLEKYEDRDFLVLMHIPPAAPAFRRGLNEEEWGKLKAVLEPFRKRIRYIFCGHIHGFHTYEKDGYPVMITAGGGAAMIHAFAAPAQKIFHSVAVDLCERGPLKFKVLPVTEK